MCAVFFAVWCFFIYVWLMLLLLLVVVVVVVVAVIVVDLHHLHQVVHACVGDL